MPSQEVILKDEARVSLPQRSARKGPRLAVGLFLALVCGVVAWGSYHYWQRKIELAFRAALPIAIVHDGQVSLRSPTGLLLAKVAVFDDELSAYLNFEYIRSLKQVDAGRVLLTAVERKSGPEYLVYIQLGPDLMEAIRYLADLEAHRYIGGFDILFSSRQQSEYARDQTALFLAAYSRPVQKKLEELPPSKLAINVARFIMFKAKTDRRAREQIEPVPSREQARDLAADIIAVAQFYSIPTEFFLGVGAMENNFLGARGDLEHKVWKKRAEPGDIVLRRGRKRILVLNYSVGVWQITRETLRYAHRLYLEDNRDYSRLPERLRPARELLLDDIDSHVLTTYAGLLLRDLLDLFHGDVSKAIGAYNGGPNNPNLQYAAGVATVAGYARNVLEQAALMNGRAIAQTRFVVRTRRR
jgi:hypothetical protein